MSVLSAAGGNRGRSHPRYAGPLLPAHAALSFFSGRTFSAAAIRKQVAVAPKETA